jgi:hypothetical protein
VVVADGVLSQPFTVEVLSSVSIAYADWWTANESDVMPPLAVRQTIPFGPSVLVFNE